MSRDPYGAANLSSSGGNRSPRSTRRVGELPTVDRSPSRSYPTHSSGGSRGSPIGRKSGRPTRSGNTSPEHGYSASYGGQQHLGSPYYTREDDLGSPIMMDDRGRSVGPGGGHHRSRSASRPAMGSSNPSRYQSLDRAGDTVGHEREFMPIREPRERSLDRSAARDRSLERGLYLEEELYGGGSRSARQSPNPHMMSSGGRDPGGSYINELQQQNNDLQRELANFKKELELTNQKLGSSMHSIKTFWSPELKKERALRKEESAKYSLINDQLKLLNSENQKQAMLVRQLEEELRMRMRNPSVEMQQQMEMLYAENEHLTREIAILRETIKELELRIETQKQTLQARDESIKKLLEMLQNKGVGGKMLDEERVAFESLQARLIESEDKIRHYETIVRNRDQELTKTKRLEEFRAEIQRRDQEILAMSAKMKTLEEQHQDYQRHIAVLKESLCAKEEHYNMLQADVEELRQRLDEKNRHIEKKTLTATQATQERNRLNNELNELRDHMDIKDRKINVLQRKLDLHEANKKLANGAAKAGEEASSLRMQLEEQKKQLEEQRRKLEEHKKGLDSKSRQLDDKEKSIADADQKLKKRKEKLDQMEAQLQRSGTRGGDVGELQKRLEQELDTNRKELEKAREDAQRSQVEMERLLQLVQMSQEEQNSKEKTIRDLQDALKNAQAKLRSQQTANAQMEESRRREEVEMQDKAVEAKEDTSEEVLRELREEVEKKDSRVAELEQDVRELEDVLIDHGKVGEVQGLKERVAELEQEVSTLETALREHSNLTELEELVGVVRQKDDRIEELEEALRESVRITAERERVLHQEETRRKQIMEKVGKLEQRLLSLQTAHALRCSTCRPLLTRLQDMERRLAQLLAERRDHLQDLAHMKQEALEAAISEKDAHLALLEVSGIRTARQAEEVDKLRADRRRLMEKLKEENEKSVQLLQEYSRLEPESLNLQAFHMEDAEDDKKNVNVNRHNGHSHQQNEIEQDSLEAVNSDGATSV